MLSRLLTFFLLLIASPAWAVNYCTDVNSAGGWKLDETSGDYADCTSNGNTGVISGTINQSETLKFGNAAGFTAVNNTEISFGSATVLDNLWDGGGTFAAWVGLNGAGTSSSFCTGGTIFAKADADGSILCINADGSVKFDHKWAGGHAHWTSTTTPFSAFDGAPHHVLLYYNSDSVGNDPDIYIDCVALTMTEGATPDTARNTDASFNLYLGITGNFGDGELDGSIDDVLYYNGDLRSSCSALSTNGIDGTQGAGGSGSLTTGYILNGVLINGFSGN